MTARPRPRTRQATAKTAKAPSSQPQERLMPLPTGDPAERRRIVIENVSPEVDCGRFLVKRIVGDRMRVEADAYADGHDEIAVRVLYKREEETDYYEVSMTLGNDDRWSAYVPLDAKGTY